MSAPYIHWLQSLAVAVPTALSISWLALPAAGQNAPAIPPPQAAKDAPKDAPKPDQDQPKAAVQDVRDTTKPARDEVRDKTKDARQDVRDTRQDARGEIRDARDNTRDTVRDPRDPRDPARDQSRDARSPENLRDPNRNEQRDVNADRTNVQAGFRAEGTRSADFGLWFERDASKGLVVADVATKGAIAKLGFREGDRIVSINGQKATRENEFVSLLFDDRVRTDRVKVIVIRDGREEVIVVEPAIFVEELSYVDHDPLESFGVIIDDRYTDKIVVWRVIPRSPAYYAGIRSGDVIVSLGNRPLANVAALVTQLTNLDAGEVQVQIGRGQANRTVYVEAPKFVQRSERRTTLRPNFDNALERREDRLERREDRVQDRQDRRDDVIPAPRTPVNPIPPVAPIPPPRVTPPIAPAPAPGAQPQPAPRPGLFPRNR